MGLDIRIPIGLMFALLGGLLIGYGLIGDNGIYQRSLGININLWWGLVMLVFGAIMLLLGRRGTSTVRPAETSFEGRAMLEEMEERAAEGGETIRHGH